MSELSKRFRYNPCEIQWKYKGRNSDVNARMCIQLSIGSSHLLTLISTFTIPATAVAYARLKNTSCHTAFRSSPSIWPRDLPSNSHCWIVFPLIETPQHLRFKTGPPTTR